MILALHCKKLTCIGQKILALLKKRLEIHKTPISLLFSIEKNETIKTSIFRFTQYWRVNSMYLQYWCIF
jgi:hypothetical protein